MLSVGLTGNVASGKSTIATHFATWGATVLDADQLVREVQAPGTSTYVDIVDTFGRDALQTDATLDRAWLRRRILQDAAARARLNRIVHPAVQERRHQLVVEADARGDAILVSDIPLLFEVLNPDQFDLIVLVDAPTDVRRQRIIEDRRLTAEDADRLIATQLPSAEKRGKSHIVIDNVGTLAALERSAWKAWRDIRRTAARATDAGRGPLLIVVAHGDDVLATMHGTVARYADAGVELYVVSATVEPSAEGLTDVVALGRATGSLDPDDVAATGAVSRVIADRQPTTVVTFGPDGLNGDADHRAVHAWTRRAVARGRAAARVFYFSTDPRLRAAQQESMVLGIDVRPWAWPGGPAGPAAMMPCGLSVSTTPAPTAMPGREWYRQAAPGGRTPRGLLDPR